VTGDRPAVIVLVAGTGTDIGKTWISAHLLQAWRRAGFSVAARKPAQSFVPGEGPTDAEVLGLASGEDPATVCPAARSYPVPMAPPMAAAALGRPGPTIADLVTDLRWPAPPVDIGLVETAGGVRSPQADDGDVIDLVASLSPDHVVLVADAGLGTINAVRLSLSALARVDGVGSATTAEPPAPPFVVLNRYDPASDLHRRNRAWLRDIDSLTTTETSDAGLMALAGRLAPPAPGLAL
jgi:dethiobiotin synthetase